MLIIHYIIWVTIGYFIGSMPFGLLLTRAAGLGDIRNLGSGNIGATNVLRTGNKALAACTLLFDGGKGLLAVWLARHFGNGEPVLPALVGLAAFIGHIFPLWLKFKGGKGVATFIGVLIGLHWQLAFIFGVVWVVMALVWRMSSLAALVATIAALVGSFYVLEHGQIIIVAVISIFIFVRHRSNIRRLYSGTETKIRI